MASPADAWHALLRPDVERTPGYCEELTRRLRDARLFFGDRIHCPFLRPFFLTEEDERRVKAVAERIATLGERVVQAALDDPAILDRVALGDAERRLVAIDPGYTRASTASRLDAFLLPDSLQFAEYNAESPAGAGYTETLADVFERLPVMERFKSRFDVRAYPLTESLLDALVASYREWGGRASPPRIAIVDWREVPTWSEFLIIKERFERLGVPTVVCDPRDLEIAGGRLVVGDEPIDLVYRRVLINDIVSRPDECRALVKAYAGGLAAVANTLRCKIPHKKAFFAVLTDEANGDLFGDSDREIIRRHVPWTRLLADTRTSRHGEPIDLVRWTRGHRDRLVIKPNDEYGGAGVTLGWEVGAREWDQAIARALADPGEAWIVQERINVRRELFPTFGPGTGATDRDMLVDVAPYLFRGRLAGFLTRLSESGLANVTSGGGQVPGFVVRERTDAGSGPQASGAGFRPARNPPA